VQTDWLRRRKYDSRSSLELNHLSETIYSERTHVDEALSSNDTKYVTPHIPWRLHRGRVTNMLLKHDNRGDSLVLIGDPISSCGHVLIRKRLTQKIFQSVWSLYIDPSRSVLAIFLRRFSISVSETRCMRAFSHERCVDILDSDSTDNKYRIHVVNSF
jgi:hypothetical protein